MKQKIVVICGPTATGKSALAVELARKFNGEIISADSRQVYTGLDIGTGKITKKEMKGVKHHLLDAADPKKQSSVVQFVEKAERAIAAIARSGKLPILVGGTGFYISALIDGMTFPNVPRNEKLRQKLSKLPADTLFAQLKKLDPLRAKSIDPQNKVRLIRAIEIAKTLGKVPKVSTEFLYDPTFIGLTLPKEELQEKINMRLRGRIKNGMIAEAKRLHTQGLSWKRMKELGLEYRFLAKFLTKEISREQMIATLEKEIWHYARRQMTWFRRDKRIHWFSPHEVRKIEKCVLKKMDTTS